MISVTWMIDMNRDTEYLECRNESSYGLRGPKIDTVKVYFYSKFDIDTIKGQKLEVPIAKAIFSNREKYGNVLDAWLEVYPNTIFFMTTTNVVVYTEAIINESHRE